MEKRHIHIVSLRLVKQAAAPLVLSSLYATWVYSSKPEGAPLTDWISPFGVSFFLLMWLLGQILRVSKQVSDADSFSELSTGIAEINQSIRELRNVQHAAPQRGAAAANDLLQHAHTIVQRGDVLAGLLQAGLAFEQAVLEKADRSGLNRKSFRSFPALIHQIEKRLGPGWKNELRVLWKLRNQIAHADKQAAMELKGQPELLTMFERGIEMLGPENDDF